jgi:hypothetical protein
VIVRTVQFIHSFSFLYMQDDHRRGATAYRHGGSAGARLAPRRRGGCRLVMKFK